MKTSLHSSIISCLLIRTSLGLLLLIVSSLVSSEENNIYMNQFAVQIDGSHPIVNRIAAKHGFINLGRIGGLEGFYLFEHNHISKRAIERNHEHHQNLSAEPEVLWVQQQTVLKRFKRDLNYPEYGGSAARVTYTNYGENFRPSYNGEFPDPLYPKQWYLHQGAVGGWDMNVMDAWQKGYTGYGVVVSILDDGIQTNHPDLIKNYDPLASTDINGNDDDPMPQDNGDNKHGTRCAGEVAAVAFNDICGIGIAFNASIGGVRMLDGTVNDAVEAKALSLNRNHIDIYSASWGPEDDGKTVDGPGPMARRAFIDGVTQGRNYKGSIFVWASGNGGRHTDNCNCDGYTNSIFTLSISSVTQRGLKPWYLEECSSTLATTYSSGTPGHDQNVVTVDMDPSFSRESMCTQDHTGTSASAPIAAAICALALEANPNLTWRDMQYLVVLTSRPEPLLNEEGWSVNAVNRKVSHKFGYGVMDASAMVNLAEQWMTVPAQHICETPEDSYPRTIPQGYGDKLEIYMSTDACWNTGNVINYLEHVQCRITLHYNPRGNLKIILESPSGTRSVLLSPRPKDIYQADFQDWPFLSVHFWGERAAGMWKLTILNARNVNAQQPGILKKWSLVFHGTEQHPIHLRSHPTVDGFEYSPVGRSAASVVQIREDAQSEDCHSECQGGCYGNGPEKCKKCRHFQTYAEPRSCVRTCSEGEYGDKNNTCRQCHSSCKTCYNSSDSACLSCADGFFVEGQNECVENCPEGYYTRESDRTCIQCNNVCADCIGEASNCTRCKSDLVMFDNQCLASCPGISYESNNHRCLECHRTCKTCIGPLSSDCVTCPPNLVHFNGTCIESCRPGFYQHGIVNECYSCDSSCLTCNATSCITCKSGWSLTNQGRCQLKTECEKGHFKIEDQCMPCHSSCDTCEGPAYSQCLTCPLHLIFYKNVCIKKCPPNTVYLKDYGCVECHETCVKCTGPKASHCLACKQGLFLKDGVCSTVCGERMYADRDHCLPCHSSCLSCNGPMETNCISCSPDLQFGEGRCQKTCPLGSFPSNSSCQLCHHTCWSCRGNGLNDCLSCKENYILDNGMCMECQQGLYYDRIFQQCKSCDTSCTTCNGPDSSSCLSCTQPLKHDLIHHRCVSCCNSETDQNCCMCDTRTDTCLSQVRRRIVAFSDASSTYDDDSSFAYGTFGIAAFCTCLLVIIIFLTTFKLYQQFGSKRYCCWHNDYHLIPLREESKSDLCVEFLQDDIWDEKEHIRT